MRCFFSLATRLARAWILVLLAGFPYPVAATNLTGTFQHPDGSPVNGKLIFLLSQPARLSDGSAQIVPMLKIFSVTSGALESGAFVYGNDVLFPTGTYYLVRLVDSNNNLLFEQKWSIQGTSLDLGTLTPTTVGVVVPDPLIKNAATSQAVQGPVTFSSPVTAFSLTLNGNLNPGAATTYDLGNTTAPWRSVHAASLHSKEVPWFDVVAYGAVGDASTDDTAAFQSALDACVAAGGGTVYVPPAAVKTNFYLVPGPLTFTAPTGWCVLRLAGEIKVTTGAAPGNTLTLNARWAIIGDTDQTLGHGTFTNKPMGAIRVSNTANDPNPVVNLAGSPSMLANVKIANHYYDGIWITSSGNVTIDNVAANSVNAASTGIPLYIKAGIWHRIRDSAFFTATPNTGPAIQVEANTTSIGLIYFDHVIWQRGSVRLKTLPTSTVAINSVDFTNCTAENIVNNGAIELDASGATGINRVTVDRLNNSDSSNKALFAGIYTSGSAMNHFTARRVEGAQAGFWKPAAGATGNALAINGLAIEDPGQNFGPVGQTTSYNLRNPQYVASPNVMAGDGGSLRVQLASPSSVTATPQVTGGTLADSTYYYVVTAIDPDGNQSQISAEKSATVSGGGGSGSVDLAWTAVTGAVSYRIYGRGQATFSETQNKANYGTSTTNSFTDNGSNINNAGSPPNWNSATDANTVFGSSIRLSPNAAWFNVPLESKLTTGTAPFIVASTTEVANLNSQQWHGKQAIDFSGSLDFGSIAAQSCAELTIAATGAATGSSVAAAWPSTLEAGLTGVMYVSGSDTVQVRLCNVTAGAVDPASRTFAGRIIQ